MPEIDEIVLQEYVATANSPKYRQNWELINSKFPELENIDTTVLQEYVATANSPKYKNDWNIINSKFPELGFKEIKEKEKEKDPPKREIDFEEVKEVEHTMKVDGQDIPVSDYVLKSAQQLQQGIFDPSGVIPIQEAISMVTENPDLAGHLKWSASVFNKKQKEQKDEENKIIDAIEGISYDQDGNIIEDVSKKISLNPTGTIEDAKTNTFTNEEYNRLVNLGLEPIEEKDYSKIGAIKEWEERLDLPHDLNRSFVNKKDFEKGYDKYGHTNSFAIDNLNELYKERAEKLTEYINTALKNEDGKTPGARKLFDLYNKQKTDDAEELYNRTVDEDLGKLDEEVDKGEYITNQTIGRAQDEMSKIYGKDKIDEFKGLKTGDEQRAYLKELLNDENVDIYYDPETGVPVDPDKLSQSIKVQQENAAMKTMEEFIYMAPNDAVKATRNLENKVAALGKELYDKGYTNIINNANLFQQLNEALPGGIISRDYDKTLANDMVDLEVMSEMGVVPAGVSFLPRGGDALVAEYNTALHTLKTARKALGLNLDLETTSRGGFWQAASDEILPTLGFEDIGDREMRNIFVHDILKDELGYQLKQSQILGAGEQGDWNVKQKGDWINYEAIGAAVPPLTKMGLEMAATYALSGGIGNVVKATTAIGDMVAVNLARTGLSNRTALNVGKFTQGVLQESYGLAGSNVIGSNVFGSEKMPVIPFAVGSQLGHLGMNWAGKVIPKAILKEATTNKSLNTVVKFLDNYGSRQVTGAIKFAARPAIGTTAIKAGEFTSGLVDVLEGEMDFSELWHEVTDVDSFFETYGALLFMGMSRPDRFMKDVVENFHYDIDNIRGNQPQWNRLARSLKLKTKKEGSWDRREIDEALQKQKDEINNSNKSDQQKKAEIDNLNYNAGRLKLKEALDQVNTKGGEYENWNKLYDRLQATMRSLGAGNELSAQDITNLAEAGVANSGTSPILELQQLGYDPKGANELYKFSTAAHNEAQRLFPDSKSPQYKKYVETSIKEIVANQSKTTLKRQLDKKEISQAYYDNAKEKLDFEIENQQFTARELIYEAEGRRQERVEETKKQATEVLGEGGEVRELGFEEFVELKKEQGGKESGAIGYGFQTVIEGKPVFVVNKDAMELGMKGSTLKHELYHPVFERKFDPQAITERAQEIQKENKDLTIEEAKDLANKESLDYIDQFTNRLKEAGLYNRVEQEMLDIPGYKNLKESGERNINIEKEFINEFIELENEGLLKGITEGIKIKDVKADVLDLKGGGEVVDFFLGEVEKTLEGKTKLQKAQHEYKELIKRETQEPTRISLSEKIENIKSVGKDAEVIPAEQVEKIIGRVAGAAWNKYGSRIPKNIAEAAGLTRKSYVESAKSELASSKWIKKWNGERQPFNQYVANKGMLELKTLATELGVESKDAPTKKRISDKITATGEREFDVKSEDLTPEEAMIAKEGTSKTREILEDRVDPRSEIGDPKERKDWDKSIDIEFDKKFRNKKGELDLEKLEDIDYSNLGDLSLENTAKFFGIDVKTLQGKNPRYSRTDKKGKVKVEEGRVKEAENYNLNKKLYDISAKYVKLLNETQLFPKDIIEADIQKAQETYRKNPTERNKKALQKLKDIKKLQGGQKTGDQAKQGTSLNIDPSILKALYTGSGIRSMGKGSQPEIKATKLDVKTFRERAGIQSPGEFKSRSLEKLTAEQKKKLRNEDTLKSALARKWGEAVSNKRVREKLEEVKTEKTKEAISKIQREVKAGSSRFAASEKLINSLLNKKGIKSIPQLLGTKELMPRIRKVVYKDLLDVGGNFFYDGKRFKMMGAGVWSSRSDVVKAMADKFPLIGKYETGVRNLTQRYQKRYENEGLSEAKALTKAKAQAIKEMETTLKAIESDMTMEISKFQQEIKQIIKSNPEKYNKFTPEQRKLMDKVINAESVKNKNANEYINNNKKAWKNLEKGKDLVLDIFRDAYNKNNKNLDIIAYMLWHPKSTSHPLRNLASIVGKELGKDIRYEEHMLPFSEYSQLIINGISKSDKIWKGLKKWLHENYTQEVISNYVGKRNGVYSSRSILDQPVRKLDKDGKVIENWGSKDKLHPLLKEQLYEALEGKREWEDVINPDIRKYNEYESERGYINPNKLNRFGESDAKRYNVEVEKKFENDPNIIEIQNHLIHQQLIGEMTAKDARELIKLAEKSAPERLKATREDYKMLEGPKVLNLSEKMPTSKLVKKANTIDLALSNGRKIDKPIKKARVFDFDDTVAKTKSKVYATRVEPSKHWDTKEVTTKMYGSDRSGRAFKKGRSTEGVMDKYRAEEVISTARKRDQIALKLEDNTPLVREALERLDMTSKSDIRKARHSKDDALEGKLKRSLRKEPKFEEKILTAEEFAKYGERLEAEGWEMDFSDFNKVIDGKKGPLFEVMKKMKEAAGDRDLFILTARAPEAAKAIQRFLKEMGIDIPLENIKGLGDGSPLAKSDWIIEKAAEGYNDFYFADDHLPNVTAVKKVLGQLDVKSKVQQARMNESSKMSEDFNRILEESTGIDRFKVFSDVKGQLKGTKARRQRFFIPPSAEDFLGLLYTTVGKGKQGDAHLKFYKDNLLDPYGRAMQNLSTDRVNLMQDFKVLKKELDVPKDLKKTTKSGFTHEQAVRVYLWNKLGEKIPGLSKTDLKELTNIIEKNPKLKSFAEQILLTTKNDGYSTPGKEWAVGTITTDLINLLNTTKRSKYLETWKQNVDIIFSKENLNKLEAAYGKKYRDALENMLTRMKSGSNRTAGGNKLSNQVLDYINNSTGAIMFFNTRSAVLQTISAANFINWSFNNPYHAGKAFANQPQYWKDFVKLMNSDYLVDRRNGLKLNINESEIADAAKSSKNKAKAALNYILEKGYLPTKYADSFAIASGGATFYRNRINDLIKNEGKTKAEAEKIAMEEFMESSEISQQSSNPSKISQQQSSDLGRVVLQFVNTPMQYARIQKRAIQDIANGRGDMKTNASKVIYYMFLQNMMFNALQQGLFALGFGDDEISEEDETKLFKAANGMLDSSLRGLGMAGVTAQVIKNLGINIYERSKRDRPEYSDAWIKLLDFSPAIKSKLSKFKSAGWPFDSKQRRAEVFDKGFSLDNPAYESMAKVITATTNLPLDRLFTKTTNIKAALADDVEAWQSVAMILGWPAWQILDEKQKGVNVTKDKEEFHYKQAKEDPSKYSKKEQVSILKQHGYTEEEIKDMKVEGVRVATIKKAEEKSGKVYIARIPNVKEDKKEIDYKPYKRKPKREFLYKPSTKVQKSKTTRNKILIENRSKRQARLYKLSKENQIDTLKSLGVTPNVIKTLKYEEDRVREIEKLYDENK